jgi:DNA-binding MarR family transcriptional regulator
MTDSQRILDCVRRLVRYLRIHDRAAQSQVGLSGAQLFVMRELGRTPSLSLSQLAQRTLTDQSSVSVVVTRLVDAGLVSRDRDTHDARRLVLNLTKNGRAVLLRAPAPPQERLIDVIEQFSAIDRKRLADLFVRIIDELGEHEGIAPMIEFPAEGPPKRVKMRE